jgi:hypothetical protein
MDLQLLSLKPHRVLPQLNQGAKFSQIGQLFLHRPYIAISCFDGILDAGVQALQLCLHCIIASRAQTALNATEVVTLQLKCSYNVDFSLFQIIACVLRANLCR